MTRTLGERLRRRTLLIGVGVLKFVALPWAMSARNALYRGLLKSMGPQSNVTDGVTILTPENISVGRRVSIHEYSLLDGSGGIAIGNDVAIANSCVIISSSHVFDDPDRPIKDQGLTYAPVSIGNDVWLGSRVSVMPGVTIGDGSVIGAGAVVTKDIPPYSIAVGTPCRVVRSRARKKEETSA